MNPHKKVKLHLDDGSKVEGTYLCTGTRMGIEVHVLQNGEDLTHVEVDRVVKEEQE